MTIESFAGRMQMGVSLAQIAQMYNLCPGADILLNFQLSPYAMLMSSSMSS
jgi:hypothetical protein